MSRLQTLLLTTLAMLAFAGNSLLCRVALRETAIDAASFTSIRLLSGALVLALVVSMQGGLRKMQGDWGTGFWLFSYAACFSFAYTSLSAGTGALLLFGAVQVTMIGFGLWRGERLTWRRAAGHVCALAGLIGLMLPGLTAPPLSGALLMTLSGIAWGVFSVRGKGAGDPALVSAGSFVRAVPFAVVLSVASLPILSLDTAGVLLAIVSGGVTSGLGYLIWYNALRGLTVTSAATVQLTVPVIAAVGGILLLGEPLGLRLVLASVAVLGGVAIAMTGKKADTVSP